MKEIERAREIERSVDRVYGECDGGRACRGQGGVAAVSRIAA